MSELSVGQLKGLPVNNNVITVPAGEVLYAPGHIVQVVSASSSTAVTSTTTTFVSAGLSATITPTSTSSQIIISATLPTLNTSTASASVYTIFRGTTSGVNLGTTTGSGNGFGQLYNASSQVRAIIPLYVVDSPSTGSPVTYTVAFTGGFGTSPSATVMHEGRLGTLTLTEIAQ
jgi:hypothetical protein